jgi:hypothetical protein
VSLADSMAPTGRRWWLVRRRLSVPTDLTAAVVCARSPPRWRRGCGWREAAGRWRQCRGSQGRRGPGSAGRAARDGLVSASHAREVGIGAADRDARRDVLGRHVQNTSAVPPAGQPAGDVPRQRIAQSDPDTRREALVGVRRHHQLVTTVVLGYRPWLMMALEPSLDIVV